MRSLPALLSLLLLLAPAAAGLGLGAAEPQRYVVGFHEWPALERGDRWEGGRVVDLDPVLRFVVVETADVARFQQRANAHENVRYVEWNDPEFGYALFVPNDARYGDAGHWGSKKIGAEKAWDRTLGSASVKVAVIDSGLRATHEEFAGQSRILQGYDTISEDSTPQDTCGHGTHVTGTIAATIHNGKGIAGMAQVSIYPIRALTSTALLLCSGSTADLAQALRLAADQGAHMSSNSWGGGSATSITDAIAYSQSKGTIVIAAAGNDGSCTNCVSEPWRSNGDKVIVVSSTDANDALSSFSSQGPQVDVAAPGTSILSAYSSNDASYSTLSGTSMATPHVTGTAALLKTLHPSWGYAEIDQHLKATAVDLGPAGKDDRFGHGRINADAATAGAAPPPPPPPANEAPVACFAHTASGLTVSVDGSCSSDADGSIASLSWSWGDGAAASTGATATHAYASAGTYTVTLTVTDDAGATAQTSQQVTVTQPGDPDPGAETLSNGVALTRTSGGAGSDQHFKISVPAGRAQLQVVLDGPACGLLGCSADLDLYVRKGARATDSAYDCRPYEGDSDETCTHANPGADWWYVRVKVFSGGSGQYSIRATYS
ncbi:MAG TPA: S8 family serine peptidase [Candidatus Thermoplasmatota archaeon]|nr:S8 family serine peptidase [Candidatus Thermoplasmatota archaeon]